MKVVTAEVAHPFVNCGHKISSMLKCINRVEGLPSLSPRQRFLPLLNTELRWIRNWNTVHQGTLSDTSKPIFLFTSESSP
jgi:hypothetical protein